MYKLNDRNLNNLYSVLILIATISLCACSNSNKPDTYQGLSADQIYSQAQKNVEKENYAEVIKDCEALEARYPYGEYSHKVQLSLINAYYKRHEPALAISAADRFIRMNPRHPNTDYAYFLKGQVAYDQNTTFMFRYLPLDRSARDPAPAKESYEAFKILVEMFPNSQYAPEARQRMSQLREQLANHELQVVEYYVKRGAHLSAANRANYVVTEYRETAAVPTALAHMVNAYRQLNMKHLAEETLGKLHKHYPNSPALKQINPA
jgi:outer membrane protein assembly factor BamD